MLYDAFQFVNSGSACDHFEYDRGISMMEPNPCMGVSGQLQHMQGASCDCFEVHPPPGAFPLANLDVPWRPATNELVLQCGVAKR